MHSRLRLVSTTLFTAALLLAPALLRAEFFGGVSEEMLGHNWRLSAGIVAGIDGKVNETFRAYYTASGQDSKQSLAESYTLDDFGVGAPYTTFGLHYERQWNYGAFRWNTLFLSLSGNSTAKRDYYLGVSDHVSYEGRKYDHMKIPKGRDFSIDFTGILTDVTYGFTPVTFLYHDDYVKFTPSLDIGLVLVGGQYDLDAGHSTGTTVYQNPPVDFVVGGASSSFIGAGAPMIGLSGEVRAELINGWTWISRVGLGYFAYDGSSSPFTSKGHRSKNLDISVLTLTAETGFSIPIDDTSSFSFGGRLQWISIDAEITSKEHDTEAILAARERFDKTADFDLYTLLLYVGYSY